MACIATSLPKTIYATWWCARHSAASFRARESARDTGARRWRRWLAFPQTACSNRRRSRKITRAGCGFTAWVAGRCSFPSRASVKRDAISWRCEYFPKQWGTALRQRTRWVTGIALQGWERFGWAGSYSEIYWFWRDRKGLVSSPLGFIANAVFVYGLATAMWTRLTPLAIEITSITLAFQILRMAIRMTCVAHVYGMVFALGSPLRLLYANLLNAAATVRALAHYLYA